MSKEVFLQDISVIQKGLTYSETKNRFLITDKLKDKIM